MRDITYKKLGACSQAKILDKISSLVNEPSVSGLLGGFASDGMDTSNLKAVIPAIASAVCVVMGKRFKEVCEIIIIATDITEEELKVDGEGSMGLEDMIKIFTEIWRVNDVSKLLDRLGNGLVPEVKKATGTKTEDLIPKPNPSSFRFPTSSPAPTAGAGRVLTASDLVKP